MVVYIFIFILLSLFLLSIFFSRKHDISRNYFLFNNITYPIKYVFIYIVLWMRQVVNRINLKHNAKDKIPKELDTKRELSSNKLAFDAVYFVVCTQNGIILSAGCERRHNNIVHGLFYIWVPNIGLLYNREMPQTKLAESEYHVDAFGSKEFYFKPIEPMKLWEIYFEGKMRLNDSYKLVDVNVKLEWISHSTNCYKLSTDINTKALATAMASESWSISYFRKLNSDKQMRYEQFGKANGYITIDNSHMEITDVTAYRDHNFGNVRDWSKIHHYVYFIILLENETKMVLGIISHPDTFSRLVIGVVNNCEHYDNVEDIKFEYDMTDRKNHSRKNYTYSFNTGNNIYNVKIHVMSSHTHYKGLNSEAVLTQKFSRFTVNNVNGYGMFEIHYNRNLHKIN